MTALLALLLVTASPEWVSGGGRTPRYPDGTHLTGFAMVEGGAALERAKNDAAAQVASFISVRIEQETRDVSEEKNGQQRYSAAAMTRATTDVRLSGLKFETHVDGGRAYALAVLERAAAAAQRRTARDAALAQARAKVAEGAAHEKKKAEADAIHAFFAAKQPIAEGLENTAIARAIGGNKPEDDAADSAFAELRAQVEENIRRLLRKPVSSLRDAVESLAFQLDQQGLAGRGELVIPALTYGTTSVSSVFGRQVAMDLERAIASRPQPKVASLGAVVKGTYLESKETLRVMVVAREKGSGRFVGSAEVELPKSAVPAELPWLPANFVQAMEDQKIIGSGELVGGDLRVELWTNKGRANLVFSQGEEMKLYMRVNKPAYVRLVYLLTNKMKLPLEQAYFIDATKVNMAVEYPNAFEVTPPFGVEQVFAVAYTDKPEPLPTRKEKVDGEEYVVVGEPTQGLVKHRGVKLKAKGPEVAEAALALTTMPK